MAITIFNVIAQIINIIKTKGVKKLHNLNIIDNIINTFKSNSIVLINYIYLIKLKKLRHKIIQLNLFELDTYLLNANTHTHTRARATHILKLQ